MAEVREQKYMCQQCGAEDTVRLFQHEGTPHAINCWKCEAGRKLSVPDQLQKRIGMFPVMVH